MKKKKTTIANFIYQPIYPLYDVCGDVIHIPDNATNGDVIKAVFPNMNIQERINVSLDIKGQTIEFTGMALKEWWNAKYKKDVEE